MNGDRARAAVLFKQLVDDPPPSWNYPERVALLRNLRALHTLRPALLGFAFLPTRKLCRR